MDAIFHFFLKSSIDGERIPNPVSTVNEFLGDIGDYVELDGAGYIIDDYATELVDRNMEEEEDF